MPDAQISKLSADQQRLVRLMSWLRFGEISGLILRDGQPVFEPAPFVVRSVKFTGSGDDRASSYPVDYPIKGAVVRMLREFTQIGTGKVIRLEIKDGLPYRGVFQVGDAQLKAGNGLAKG